MQTKEVYYLDNFYRLVQQTYETNQFSSTIHILSSELNIYIMLFAENMNKILNIYY